MRKIGYACINMTLQKEFGYTCNRGMIKRTFKERGLDYAGELALKNCLDIIPILKWNADNDIKIWRLSSEIFPWFSEYDFDELPNIEEIRKVLLEVGRLSKELDIRLTFHPGPFNVLGSPRPEVVKKTIDELNKHSDIFNMMGFEPSPENKVNIHIRATYGDKESTKKRFIDNFDLLEEHTKKRLTIENDDKPKQWSVQDLLPVAKATGAPIVFDVHHHRFCTGGLDAKDAALLAFSTWPEDIVPVMHYSESHPDKMPQAHSEYIEGPIDTYDQEVDVMIEAKAKELALLKYRRD